MGPVALVAGGVLALPVAALLWWRRETRKRLNEGRLNVSVERDPSKADEDLDPGCARAAAAAPPNPPARRRGAVGARARASRSAATQARAPSCTALEQAGRVSGDRPGRGVGGGAPRHPAGGPQGPAGAGGLRAGPWRAEGDESERQGRSPAARGRAPPPVPLPQQLQNAPDPPSFAPTPPPTTQLSLGSYFASLSPRGAVSFERALVSVADRWGLAAALPLAMFLPPALRAEGDAGGLLAGLPSLAAGRFAASAVSALDLVAFSQAVHRHVAKTRVGAGWGGGGGGLASLPPARLAACARPLLARWLLRHRGFF